MRGLREDRTTQKERALLDELMKYRYGHATPGHWILDEEGCILVLMNWRNRNLSHAKARYGCFGGLRTRDDTFQWVLVELTRERSEAEQERQELTEQLTGAYI